MTQQQPNTQTAFRDRRDTSTSATPPGVERRQFANSHDELSPEARELATAIDDYKVRTHRRFVTYEEILSVLRELGYSRRGG